MVNEKREAGFRGIRPLQSDDPSYLNVPDGNSENSVSSVLKKRRVATHVIAHTGGIVMARRAAEEWEEGAVPTPKGLNA